MITKPTTLILGAGASAPFGFPTGYDLLRQVLTITEEDAPPTPEFLSLCEVLHKHQEVKPVPSKHPTSAEKIRFFRECLLKSGAKSVDAFLEHRREFITIGKFVMAIAIIRWENEATLFHRDGKNWYEYLFGQLNTKYEDFEKNKLSILTFNYDRSLEFYLLTVLASTYGKSFAECKKKLESIPIIHLHGDLGNLGFIENEKTSTRPYVLKTNGTTIQIAATRIKIIHEGLEEQFEFVRAKEIISKSEVICFLGFGYHELNMERLGFNPLSKYQDYKASIFGTTYGLTTAEANRIANRYRLPLRRGPLPYPALDVLEFLRETGVLFDD